MLQLIVIVPAGGYNRKDTSPSVRHINVILRTQQYLPINVLWFLLDQNTAVQLIFLRGKFQVSLCVHEVIPQFHLAL
jgi:hypothetical protein